MHSWCVESEKWVEIFFHHWTSEKIPFLYFFLHKSWIWRTLGHDTKKILIAIFIMLQKNIFGQKNFWISCTGSKVPFWQFFNFAKMALLNLCMKFKIFFGWKHSFEALWKWEQEKKLHNLSQGPPNLGFMQEKVQKGDFLKKDSRELNFFSCFRFLWISLRPGTLNWERVVFLLSKIIYRKCVRLGLVR